MQFLFVHINKTGGTSIEHSLGLRKRHATAGDLIRELGRDAWDCHFSFAFVRNPWDRVVSHYAYRVKTNKTGLGDGKTSFADWVRESYGARNPRFYDQPNFFTPQRDWLSSEDGDIVVSFVGRFERLQADFDTICATIGQPSRLLPHLNPSDRGHYRAYYDDDTRQIVEDWFRPDIEGFGYAF